jgi:hypothetical protein
VSCTMFYVIIMFEKFNEVGLSRIGVILDSLKLRLNSFRSSVVIELGEIFLS